MRYLVVFERKEEIKKGFSFRSFSSFASEENFLEWYAGKMGDGTTRPISDVFGVIGEGVSIEEAERLVKTRPLLDPEYDVNGNVIYRR